MPAITPQEKHNLTLHQFKDVVKDLQLRDSSDAFLTKWLIARNYDVEQAEKMLLQSLEWRRLHKVDDILATHKLAEVLTKYYSLCRCGTDKLGCPLWISSQGRIDYKGILNSVTKKEFSRSMIYLMEIMSRDIQLEKERTGRLITQQTCIFDVAELSMRILSHKPTVDALIEVVQTLESRYPEIIRRVYFINVSRPFTFVYNVILKPFIHPATAEKIRMFASEKEWKSALLQEIDADQLPVCYGGAITDPIGDPKSPIKFNFGGPYLVPKSFYLATSAPIPKKYMDTINVNAGGKKKLKFTVDDVNSILRWEFFSENGDISYRVYYKNTDGIVEFSPLERIDSHLMIEEGQITCSMPGKYVLEFDNSFSYMRSKKVHYFADVEAAKTGK